MSSAARYAPLLLIIAMLSMQSSGAFAKVLFQQFPLITVAAMRLLFAGLILAVIFRIWQVQWRNIRRSALVSYGIALAGMNLLFYLAIERLPLGIAVAFEFMGPLSIALMHIKQKLDVLWLSLACIGLLILLPIHGAVALDWLGVGFALAAGACWALYIVAGQKPTGISGNHTVCLGMLIGMCILMPMALLVGIPTPTWHLPNLAQFALLALLASAIPFSLEMVALRSMNSFRFGTLMSLEPAVAALSGILFLHEQLSLWQCIAILLLIAASIGCSFRQRQH